MDRKMVDYKILAAPTGEAADFEQEVRQHIQAGGWEAHGSLVVQARALYQAVVRYEDRC